VEVACDVDSSSEGTVSPVGDPSESGVVEGWLSFAAWMMTVRVVVEVTPDWSVVYESDMLSAKAGRRMGGMPLPRKRDHKDYVRRRTLELAESGRFEGWLGIEFELRYVEGFQKARIWLDYGPIREELDILCRYARTRKSASTSTKKAE
jgi:hypothetical protein